MNAGSSSLGYKADGRTALPGFVPEQFAPVIAKAAQRWNVSGTLLAAQIYAESNFDPFAKSGMGAVGIAVPPVDGQVLRIRSARSRGEHRRAGTLRARPAASFASVPLALAAYNAGPGWVQARGCIPPIPEAQAYVAKNLALLGGAGLDAVGSGEMKVRLVA